MLKIIDVERMVTRRVEELAADTASKPSSTARSAENRNTASATLIIVNAVRRLLRRALLRMRPTNFMIALPPALRALPLDHLLHQRALLEVQQVGGSLGRVRVVRHHHDGLLELLV